MTQKVDVDIVRSDGSEIVLRDQSTGNPALRRRIMANLDTARRIEITRHVTSGPPKPHPPGSHLVDLSVVRNVLILADDPWPALDAPPHYRMWVTADLGYREHYLEEREGKTFIQHAKDQGRPVYSWCDCKAVLGEGTAPDVAIKMAADFDLAGACGEGEHSLAFQAGWDAGMRMFVVNLSALNDDQITKIRKADALVTAELYLNKQPGQVVDWKEANAGIGSNCGATYESSSEGAVATPIDAYNGYPNADYPHMSWYCGSAPKPDFARLP